MGATHHHKVIRELVAEVRRLRAELDERDEDDEMAEIRAWNQGRAARADADDRAFYAQRAEEQARREAYERSSALEALERARRRGDERGEERALSDLRAFI